MAFESVTPNMGLIQPGVGLTAGPQYASDLNASLTIIDNHNHTPGSGVQITPAGIDINTDLVYNGNGLTTVKSLQFMSQLSPLSLLGSIYESGVDLYYTDGNGNQVQITSGGSVNAGSGSITGLVSPASATYISGTQTFVWQSGVNIAANMDMGSATLRNLTTSSTGITLSPPSSLPGSYTITLPSTTAAANGSILQMSTAGVVSNNLTVDNSTIKITSNQLVVQPPAAGSITGTMIASATITASNIAAQTIGLANQVLKPQSSTATANGMAVSAGASGAFTTGSATFVDVTNLSVTLVTTGRPIYIQLQTGPGASVGYTSGVGGGNYELRFLVNGSPYNVSSCDGRVPASSYTCLVSGIVANTYTIKVQARADSTGANVQNCSLLAYEI